MLMLLMSHPEQLCVNPKFIREYLLNFLKKCPKLSKKGLYLAAWGSQLEEKKEEKLFMAKLNSDPSHFLLCITIVLGLIYS